MLGLVLRWLVLPGLLLSAGAVAGWRVHDWKDAAGRVRAERQVVKAAARQGAVNQAVAVQATAARDRIVYRTKTLLKEVPTYVSPEADRRFPLPWGFVRLHDRAASGGDLPAVPDRAGAADDTASDVAASEAAVIIAANYGACHLAIDQLKGWQDWYRGQAAAWRDRPPPASGGSTS